MISLIVIIIYLLGMFVTFCGILLNIYFRPSEKEEWGDEYTMAALLMLIFWPIAIIVWIVNNGIILAIDKVIAYVAKKGESRQTKKSLTRNINKSKYYGTKNSK